MRFYWVQADLLYRRMVLKVGVMISSLHLISFSNDWRFLRCNNYKRFRVSLIPKAIELCCIHFAHTATSRPKFWPITPFSLACIIVNFIPLTNSVKITIRLWIFMEEKVTNIFTDTFIAKGKEILQIITICTSESKLASAKIILSVERN